MKHKLKGWKKRKEFEDLTRPQLAGLYRFAFQKVRDASQAEDLVQDVCLKAYQAFDSFKRGTNYKAWIFRILINIILDFQRKVSREPLKESLEPENSNFNNRIQVDFSSHRDPESLLTIGSLSAEVQKAIREMTEEWQAVVFFNFVEGFSYQETADLLNCPIGTVMSRLYRARQFLRQRLEKYVDIESGKNPKHSAGQFTPLTSIHLIQKRSRPSCKGKKG